MEIINRHDEISCRAYFKWQEAGSPDGDGKDFWLAAEKEFNQSSDKDTSPFLGEGNKPVRYIALKGIREIARDNDLSSILDKVAKKEKKSASNFSDVVVWDLGTATFPMMSVVASTCLGWLTIKTKGKKHIPDNFGASFTTKELKILNHLFTTWKSENKTPISTLIKNIYEHHYIKGLKINDSIELNGDDFKVFINKLLWIVNNVSVEEELD